MFYRDGGTGYTNTGYGPTKVWNDYSYDYCPPINYSHKELLRMENAIKATGAMIALSREYMPKLRGLMVVKPVGIVPRMLFSNSGRLPKRIRRIRKSR